MVFLLAVFKGVPAGLPLRPGGNGKEFKLSKIPTQLAGRDDLDGLPRPSTNRAHLSV